MTTRCGHRKSKSGVTLLEVMLASSITAVLVLVLLETLIFGARIAKENSQLLAADAYAFDVAWRLCNVAHDNLPTSANANWYAISSNAAPAISLAGWDPARCYVTITNAGGGKVIAVDVQWGPSGRRRSLNSYHRTEIFKSKVERGLQ